MRDHRRPDDPSAEALAFQAMLYAGGELDPPQARAFEDRLGTDPEAREALCRAVQLTYLLAGEDLPRPDPAYRDRVRARLRPARGFWRRLVAKRPQRGHPLAWIGLGAAAAVLLMACLGRGPEPAAPADVPVARQPTADKPAAPEPAPAPASPEEAKVWAELHSSDHLTRAHEDEARRRHRAEVMRLARREEHRTREPVNPVLRR